MNKLQFQIREELFNLSEEEYKTFSEKLIPNCNNILGVRIPKLRKMAKQMKKEESIKYLKIKEVYFEETMLKALIIGNINSDIESILNYVKNFIPKINNWSICDSFCNSLKITKKYKNEFWNFLTPYYKSNKTYEVRFAVVMCLNYFIEETYIQKLFSIFDSITQQDYYVKMAIAWAISICFIKFPNLTMSYLKKNKLDDETYNKSLQKIRESLRVDKQTKSIIKSMKR